MHDARIGRFLSVDPIAKKYPFYSPYLNTGNNPILFKDELGAGPIIDFMRLHYSFTTWLAKSTGMTVENSISFNGGIGMGVIGANARASYGVAIDPLGNVAVHIAKGAGANYPNEGGGMNQVHTSEGFDSVAILGALSIDYSMSFTSEETVMDIGTKNNSGVAFGKLQANLKAGLGISGGLAIEEGGDISGFSFGGGFGLGFLIGSIETEDTVWSFTWEDLGAAEDNFNLASEKFEELGGKDLNLSKSLIMRSTGDGYYSISNGIYDSENNLIWESDTFIELKGNAQKYETKNVKR
ncbi:MAG: hypothetical protein ACI9Z3_001913 [Roseivirga sp.]